MQKKFLKGQAAAIILAVLVGLLTGFGAVGFRLLINVFHEGLFGTGANILSFMGSYYVILVPAIGGAIVGPLIYFFAKEAKGHGVPEVMDAVVNKGGKIRPRVVIVKSLASALSIGSGGSIGREGPIVQIGSAIGSSFGQLIKLPTNMIRSLVACGAAGGIAATFNAPIGGVLFSLEVIMGRFIGSHVILVIISSVCSSVIAQMILGNEPAFSVAAYPMNSPYELFLYALLGVISAFMALIYTKSLYKFEDIFDNINFIPEYVKPVIGGFIIGVIGLKFPQVFGVGYPTIESALAGEIALGLIASLILIKLLATIVTIGSGASGGVFAPGLFIGAMLGGTVGIIYNLIFPDIATIPAAYALAGMGAVFAASAQAPITGIIMLFEMTNDYRLILPLMITCIISYLIFGLLSKEDIYTTKLIRRGVNLKYLRRPDVLKDIYVFEVMNEKAESIYSVHSVQKALKEVNNSLHHGFPVVDIEGKVVGVVTRKELRWAVLDNQDEVQVKQLISRELIYVQENDTLNTAVTLMSKHGVGRLPVLGENNNLVGIISRSDIIKAYGLMARINNQVNEQTS